MQNLLPCFVILSNAFLFLVQEFGLSTPPPASTPTVRSGEEKLPDNCQRFPSLLIDSGQLRAKPCPPLVVLIPYGLCMDSSLNMHTPILE